MPLGSLCIQPPSRHLFRFELARQSRHPVVGVAIAALVVSGAWMIIEDRNSPDTGGAGALAATGGAGFDIVVPLCCGLLAASVIPEHRARGAIAQLLLRGLSRRGYLTATVGANALVAVGVVILASVLIEALAWGMFGGGEYRAAGAVGPVPSLFATAPLLADGAFVMMSALGAAAITAAVAPLACVVRNPYACAVAPVFVVIGALFLVPTDLAFLSPHTILDLDVEYADQWPASLHFVAAPVYWLVTALAGVVLAWRILERRDVEL